MKKILIISFSDLKNDPRVYRQIDFLRSHYQVTTIGLNPAQLPGVEFIPIARQNHSAIAKASRILAYKLGYFERLYWDLYKFEQPLARLAGRFFDLVIANDIIALPLAMRITRGAAKFLLDAHEYAPRQFEHRWSWNFFFREFNQYLCRTYLPRCDRMTTVSAGIAAEYQKIFGIQAQVITNSCEYFDLQPSVVSDPLQIRLIHHGNANPARKLETMIRLMDRVGENLTLDLMLVPVLPGYYRKLKKKAAHNPRIGFPPPLAMSDIVPYINRYDIGLCFFEPTTFNLRHVLPNKFFEFIQARLAVISGPSPEMAELIRRYDCGIVTEDFSLTALQGALAGVSRERIIYFKNQSQQAAREISAAKNRRKILDLVQELIGS